MDQFYHDNYFTEFHYFSQRLIPFRSHQKTKEESTKEAKTPISDDRKDSTVSSNVSKKYDFISQIQAFQYHPDLIKKWVIVFNISSILFHAYRNKNSNSPKFRQKDPSLKNKNKNKHGSARQEKMSEDEVFLNMLIETFSPKPTDATMTGLGTNIY